MCYTNNGDGIVKKKKKKLRVGRILVALVVLGLIIFGLIKLGSGLFDKAKEIIDRGKDAYLSSLEYEVQLYNMDYTESIRLVRGTTVKLYEKEVEQKDEAGTLLNTYRKIKYEDKEYLLFNDYVTFNVYDIIKEKEMYVRTPLVIYESADDIKILSYAKKGDKLDIVGYDKLNSDGSVNMYKVKYNEVEGYVYSKYVLQSEEEAKVYYDHNGTYATHVKRGNRFGGGNASKLDYYPYEKGNFEDNVMPSEVRSLYLNSGVLNNLDAYINLAKESNINAFVVDIKENTAPAYPAKAMETYSKTNYDKAINSYDNYKAAIQKLKDNGFYVIGRIVVFKDSYYITDHPEDAISSKSTGSPYKLSGSYWPSAYSRGVWEFNVALAKEAVLEMGFNEIQFDYVRFPDRIGSIESSLDMKNKYGEDKAQALQGFLMYACDEIHKVGAYVSVDVFGESANSYVAAYGQYWSSISNIVDVISGMPYPDHFAKGEYGLDVPWEYPYQLLKAWGSSVMKRQAEAPTPAIVRTWIQTYNAIYSPHIIYDSNKISEQIRGLYDAGLTGGYMTWNGTSSLAKYKEVSSAFKRSYINENN